MAQLISTLTCPSCGYAAVETMPTDGCIAFHTCAGCQMLLTPKAGDCCVFCSYGDMRCPSVQDGTACAGPIPFSRGAPATDERATVLDPKDERQARKTAMAE